MHKMREVVIPSFMTVSEGSCKINDTFKVGECGHQANCRLFKPCCHGEILWCLETRSRQSKCLSKKSHFKANHPPKADICGRDCSSKCIQSLLPLKPTKDDSVRDEATTQQGQSEGQKELVEKIDLMGYGIGVWMTKKGM